MKPPILFRDGSWRLRRRVPARYQPVETRKEVSHSLHTDSKAEAIKKWPEVWDNLIAGWEARLAGDSADAEKRHAAAVELAHRRGFRYVAMDDVLKMPTDQILARVEAATDAFDARALAGVVPKPSLTVRQALKEYWPLTKDQLLQKSPNQIRLWENPRKKAINNFVEVCGNKAVQDITRDDLLDFRQWWMERISEGQVRPDTANKDFTHLGSVLRTVNDMKRLGLDLAPILTGLAFKEGQQRTRPPFSSQWIKSKILAKDALAGLNKEARCIVLAMINTGARPSELCTLNETTIDLTSKVPNITVKSDGREVKSKNAFRIIPLIGVSLAAVRECPAGFPRYFDKPGLSATINSYFEDNGLRETPEHSFYSLRHSFEDRLLAEDIDYRIRKDLMGQRMNGERYGRGATLEKAARLLEPISF